MTTFEPGRIYSGVVDGKRQIIFRDGEHWHHVDGDGNLCGGDRYNGNYTDVRGPLVVLDLGPYERQHLPADLREIGFDDVADQIEEQTRPPLQVGWHEVEEKLTPWWWDGERWGVQRDQDGKCPIVGDDDMRLTSRCYVGKGSQS